MKYLFLIICLIAGTLIFLTSCDKDDLSLKDSSNELEHLNSEVRSSQDSFIIGSLSQGTISLDLTDEMIDSLWSGFYSYSELSNWNNIESQDLFILDSIGCLDCSPYLVFKTVDDGLCYTVGVEISKEGSLNDLNYILHNPPGTGTHGVFPKHTCKGNPCNSCSFVRSGFLNLRIDGCKCDEEETPSSPLRCDHTVESGSGLLGTAISVLSAFL